MPDFVLSANPKKRKRKLFEKRSNSNLFWSALFFVFIVVADQITKLMVLDNLIPGEPVEVLGRFFMFTLVFNDGGAMGTNFGTPAYYLISSSVILIVVLIYGWLNRHNSRIVLPLSMIAGGAVGNIIDRIRFDRVVDFIDVDFFNIDLFGFVLNRWWTFNIADAGISVGIVLLFFFVAFDPRVRDSSPVSEQPTAATNQHL